MNARTKARDVEISPRSLITANIEKCARFARDRVITAVSFCFHFTTAITRFYLTIKLQFESIS